MAYNLEKIDLERIDSSDCTFHITTCTEIHGLKSSMIDAGLMVPPLIVMGAEGRYQIISGFRRTAAAAGLGWRRIHARVLDPGIPAISRIKYAIAENSFQRQLNIIEQSRSIQLISPFFTSEKELAGAAANLGLPANASMLRKLFSLSTLPEQVQNSLLNNTLSFAVATVLEAYDPDDSVCISSLFDILKPGLNKQREILTMLTEISIIENIAISDLVGGESIQALVTDDGADRSRKTERLRGCLKNRRFPEITRAEEKFKQNTRALKLDADTRLLPPGSFEGNEYCLTFIFRNVDELKDRQAVMGRIIKNPIIREILS